MALQDFQDTNPYSRNLIFISVGIILFILADGQLYINNEADKYLKIHVMNIRFLNVDVLINFVLIAYLWFNFRFWQSEKIKISEIIYDNTYRYTNCFFSKQYIKNKLYKDFDKEHLIGISFPKNIWLIHITGNGGTRKGNIKLEGIQGIIFLNYIKCKVAFFDSRVLTCNFP